MSRIPQNNKIKYIALSFWLILLGGFFGWKYITETSYSDILLNFLALANNKIEFVVFILLVYTFRPLILFPTSWITLLVGAIFGWKIGLIIALGGEIITAIVPYFIGKFFGSHTFYKTDLPKWTSLIYQNTFMGILLCRLVYVPFDPVNYISGFLRLKLKPYLLGTFLGLLPSIFTFVYLGSSVENLNNLSLSNIGINKNTVIISGIIFITTLVFSAFLYKKNKHLVT